MPYTVFSITRGHASYFRLKLEHEILHCQILNVIRLSLGKLLVNLWQVVKRTNYPTNTSTNGVVGRPWVFGSCVRSPPSTIIFFSDFPHVEVEKYSPRVSPGNETAWILKGPPVNRADLLSRRFRGGECYKA